MYLPSKVLDIDFRLGGKINDVRHILYAIKYCDILPSYFDYFAVVGGNMTSIYKNSTDISVELVQCFVDEDNEEILYCCAWGSSQTGLPILYTGGLRGVVKGINCITSSLDVLLIGHGNSVNDIKVHPVDDGICFTASKDESVRMWDTRSSLCIAIFAGDKGHRYEVLSIAIHPVGNCFVSAGLDTSVKIWNLEEPAIQTAIQACRDQNNNLENITFQAITVQFPIFNTSQVHTDYIDNVLWVGDLVLSQATRDKAVLWAPHPSRYKGAPLILREFDVGDLDLFFLKMDVCIPLNIFAVAGQTGKVSVFHLGEDGEPKMRQEAHVVLPGHDGPPDGETYRLPHVPQTPLCTLPTFGSKFPGDDVPAVVRHVSFSGDGSRLACCTQGGAIIIWNICFREKAS